MLERRDAPGQLRVLGCKLTSAAIAGERLGGFVASRVNLGNAFESCQVFRGRCQDGRQLGQGRVEVPVVNQGAAQRGPGGGVLGVQGEADPARLDGFVHPAGTPELFCEGGKRKRRRILLDPASQFLNARAVRHVDSLAEA